MLKGKFPTLSSIGEDRPGAVVVFLGTAARGPVMEPVIVAGPEHVLRVFGSDGTLPSAYRLASRVNPQAIYCLMRVNGSTASLSLEVVAEDGESCLFTLTAVEAGSLYNDVAVKVEVLPGGTAALAVKYGRVVNTYNLVELPTLGELVDKINLDAALGYSPVTASTTSVTMPSSALAPLLAEWTNLEGGADDLTPTKNELYRMLGEAYMRLEGLRTDIIVPVGARFDDVLTGYVYGASSSVFGAAWYTSDADYLSLTEGGERATFHGQLIGFCRRQFARGLMAHGVLGMRPMPEPELLAESGFDYISGLVNVSCLATREGFRFGQDDLGYYVSLVLGDLELDGEYCQAAPAYAALLAATGTETTTGMPVSNTQRQRTYLDGMSLRYAADSGLVTFYHSEKKGLCVYSGVTAALPGRPLHYVANVRTAQFIIHALRLALNPYIGEMEGIIPVRDAVEQVTGEVLRSAKESGLVQSYSFAVRLDQLDGFSVACTVDLTLRAKYAVEDISVSTTMVVPG